MPEAGGTKHQCGLTVREGADETVPPSDLTHDPLLWIIGPEPSPVGIRIAVVGECLLDGGLPPTVALNDHRLEGLLTEFRHLQCDRARLGVKLALIAAGSRSTRSGLRL